MPRREVQEAEKCSAVGSGWMLEALVEDGRLTVFLVSSANFPQTLRSSPVLESQRKHIPLQLSPGRDVAIHLFISQWKGIHLVSIVF